MPKDPVVFMFSGQGSQHFQMGRELFDQNVTFKRCMLELDDIQRSVTGQSVVEELYISGRGRGDVFDQIALTHPAIFMVEYAMAQTLMQAGVYPDLVVGASLGSFAAATVAGMLLAPDALRAVLQQANTIDARCERGGMLAVLEDVTLYDQSFLCEHSELSSVNFATHFVVSARAGSLARIEQELRKRQMNFQRLPVRFAFHSQWIDTAKSSFLASVNGIATQKSTIPMLCCCEPGLLDHLPARYLWDTVRNPIRFHEAITLLELQGSSEYIDVGPSGTLAAFLKYRFGGKTHSKVHSIMTMFGVDMKNLAAVSA